METCQVRMAGLPAIKGDRSIVLMQSQPIEAQSIAHEMPGLRMLVLHGSRARDEAHERSDWDFAYLADPPFDDLELRARLARALGTDDVDVVDLARAGGLLRYRAARDGKVLFQREPGEFERFAVSAITFWLDVEPIVRPEYQHVLNKLG